MSDRPLEPSADELRSMIDEAADRVVEHVASLDDQPAMATEGAEAVAETLREPVPEEGEDLEDLLDLLFEEAIPASLTAPSGGYLAYIPGGGVVTAAVADLIADATNRYTGVRPAAPALVELEATAVDWFREIVGLPEGGGGILTTGGSMANQVAVTTARRDRLPEDFLDGTIYASDQVHHSVAKAAVLSGFPADRVQSVPTDDGYRMDPGALGERIQADRDDGREPFLVVANAGTVNTGAVDDLEELSDVARSEDLWLHVDGAYGGFFCMTDRGAEVLAGIERADSVTLDPHKTLFLPYGTGALLVRDLETLRRAHGIGADYLPEGADEAPVSWHALGPELTRPFRGLRVWLAIKLHGLEAFRACLDEKLDLARWAADRLRCVEGIEVVAPPELSVLAFRLEPDGVEGEALDKLNRELMDRVNRRRRVHLSGTTLDGRFTPRIAVVAHRTRREHVEACVEDVVEVARDLGG